MLRPMVCDCEKEAKACAEPAQTSDSPIVQVSSPQPEGSSPTSLEPSAVQSSAIADLNVIDVEAKEAVFEDPAKLKRQFPVPLVAGFRGNFSKKAGTEYAGVDKTTLYFRRGKWRQQASFDTLAAKDELESIDLRPFAAEMIKDGTLELVLFSVDTSQESRRVYRFRIYKVIGERIGLVFDQPFAVKTASGVQQLAKIAIVEGVHHPRIRVTPYSEDGLLDVNNARLLVWNKWEGMFRVPTKAPTAP